MRKFPHFTFTGGRNGPRRKRDVSRCSEELHLGDNFSNYYQMANGQSLCFSRTGGPPPPPPEGVSSASASQLQEVSRVEPGGEGVWEHNTGPMINLPAGNLFLIETLRVFQPLARAHSEDKDFERRVEGGGGRGGSGGNTPTIALIFFSLPFFSFLSFFLPSFLFFFDSSIRFRGYKGER